MTRITAIELENFQSIERRTRIDLKPITLLFGPNSAGKSAIFDAIELLRVILDPIAFDEQLASDMVNRWARRNDTEPVRELFLAVEFIYNFEDPFSVWNEDANWQLHTRPSRDNNFMLETDEDFTPINRGDTIRIELGLKVVNKKVTTLCRLSELSCSVQGKALTSITKHSLKNQRNEASIDSTEKKENEDYGERSLTIYDNLDSNFMDYKLRMYLDGAVKKKHGADPDYVKYQNESGNHWKLPITCDSLSPLKIISDWTPQEFDDGEVGNRICRNFFEILFYFGTILFQPTRGKPGVVVSDRRAPKPTEALAVVDLGLKGWWSKDSFAPSSPADLLSKTNLQLDEHFQGLAEVAHADLLLRASQSYPWGGEHAEKHVKSVQNLARIFELVNRHLEKNIFTEKLYKLACASTLMVPLDLSEDDISGYYSLAQPAAVRLFLQDGSGQKIELQDVGSGIPFVLPILYALASQGFVKVQQPELHLHPALQSSVADVFIEELHREGSGHFLIETHSEHILLRLLRRIRDTEKEKCLSDDMRLSNKDVAVYYFDPNVNGSTTVTQQLITPLGDFYTDWPRGFFAERNRDLFDE